IQLASRNLNHVISIARAVAGGAGVVSQQALIINRLAHPFPDRLNMLRVIDNDSAQTVPALGLKTTAGSRCMKLSADIGKIQIAIGKLRIQRAQVGIGPGVVKYQIDTWLADPVNPGI